MRRKKHSNECVFILTDTHSLGSINLFMAKLKQIVAGLTKQSFRKLTEVYDAEEEMGDLLDAYQRYQELHAHAEREMESAKIGLALVLNIPQKVNIAGDAYDPKNREECERAVRESETVPIAAKDLDINKFPLWKIIREILRQVPEMRVYELEDHLKNFGVITTRSAIESALLTHAHDFKVERRTGREKFVSWKEGKYAPATTRKRK